MGIVLPEKTFRAIRYKKYIGKKIKLNILNKTIHGSLFNLNAENENMFSVEVNLK